MAAENNRFYVRPVNPLESLMMGAQGYESAQKRTREADLRTGRSEAGQMAAAGDSRGALARLLGAGDIQGAGVIATLGKSDTTDEIKEYNFDARQLRDSGRPVPSFGDWKAGLKRAGATNVSVNTGEKAFDKTLAEGEAKRFLELNKTGQSATSQLNSLDVMERATKDPGFYSGVGAERFVLPLKQGIAAFGGDPKGAASMEVFRANSSKAVIDSMGGSLGTGFSNADRDFVLSQVPSLANTPEGNQQLIDVTRAVAKRNQQIAQRARDYAKRHGGRLDAGFDDELAAWAEKNPLFPRTQAQPAQPAPQGSPQAGSPPMQGAKQAPDGKWYVPDPKRPGKYLMIQQ